MCTDYRKVNSVTKTDTCPCIDNIGKAKYVLFDTLSEAKLTINLAKCELCHAKLKFQ